MRLADFARGIRSFELHENLSIGRPRFARHEYDGGDAAKLGLGVMTDERWKVTYETMVKLGLLKPEVDWKAAYTTRFVKDLKVMP